MNKFINILFIILFVAIHSKLSADDASAVAYEHWSYGNIKAETPNKQISLDKELMIVTPDYINAIFIFRNTTEEYIETPCVFPISVSLMYEHYEEDKDSIYVFTGQGASNPLPWNIYLDKKVSPSNRENGLFNMAKSDLKAAKKKLRKYTFKDYSKRMTELTNSTYLSCDIQQNGENVEIKNVGVETGDQYMDIYFYHFLKFKPNEVSKVVVSYPIESFSLRYDCDEYSFPYDISSGGTWKNNIKSFIVYSTMNMESVSNNPINKDFEHCEFSDWKIYYKRDYKPIKGDRFDFSKGCGTYIGNVSKDWQKNRIEYYLKNDSIIKITSGRDELNPYAIYPKKKSPLPFVVNATSSNNQDVTPLFDGNLYTSYVTSSNSYIEFTLKKTAVGPFVSNGFIGNSFNEKIFYAKQVERKDEEYALDSREEHPWDDDYNFPVFQDTLWKNTSRLKSMVLTRFQIGESKSDSFSLADKYGVLPREFDDWKGVNSVHNPKVLMPGKYRLTFDSIYKGDKFSNIGLSEIWFYEYPIELVNMIAEDKKDSFPIFQDCYKYIESDWVTNYDFIPYKFLRSQNSPYYKECLQKYGDDSLKLELDSLGNYCIGLEMNNTSLEQANSSESKDEQSETKGDNSSQTIETNNGVNRILIIGAVILAILACGSIFILRKKKGNNYNKK